LKPLLPRSRRTLTSLQLCLNDIDTGAYFYVPISEHPTELSGMVLTLFGEYPDPTSNLSYFSKEEDVQKVNELIEKSVDWKKGNTFGAICDWHVPGLLEMCKRHGLIDENETLHLYELPSLITMDDKINVQAQINVQVHTFLD